MFNKFLELSRSNIFASPITKASCSAESPTRYRGTTMAAAAEGQFFCIYGVFLPLLVSPFIGLFQKVQSGEDEDMQFPKVLKEQHVKIQGGLIKKEVEFPGLIKKAGQLAIWLQPLGFLRQGLLLVFSLEISIEGVNFVMYEIFKGKD